MDFKAPGEFLNALSNEVPGTFYGSGGHNERNCLQYRANFQRSREWQVILISKSACVVEAYLSIPHISIKHILCVTHEHIIIEIYAWLMLIYVSLSWTTTPTVI